MKQTDLEKLLADMSLKEKVDQMLQLSGAFYLGDENSVLTGPANDMGIGKEDLEMAGSILGAAGADTMKKLKDDYMAKQPHHIPMLFMMDVIHGMKTIFPAPLAQGATFDPELSGECASAAAKEASAAGLHVTFSPMVDLVRDARWGRVVESTGEDPYLNSRFSEAIVKGWRMRIRMGIHKDPYLNSRTSVRAIFPMVDLVHDGCHSRHEDHFPGAAGAGSHF